MKDGKTIKWINTACGKAQRVKIGILIALNVLFSCATVFFAFAVKAVIDGAVKGNERLLVGGAIALGITVVLQFILRVLINGLAEHLKARIDVNLKNRIFKKILVAKYPEIVKYHSGDLLNRLTSDVNVVSDGITSIVPSCTSAIARLILAVGALIYLDWVFAVAFVVAGLMVFTVITLMRERLKKLHKSAQESEGEARSFMQENVENAMAVKAFSVNDEIMNKSQELHETNFKIKMKRRNYAVTGHALYNLIFSAGYLFALVYGAIKLLQGSLEYGTLTAILQLVNNVQVPFASLSNVVPKYYATLSSAERLIEIEGVEEELSERIEDVDKTYAHLNSIIFDGVNFSYGQDEVLSAVNIKIDKGDFVAIIGESGIGKTTLMKLLVAVYEPSKGRVLLSFDDGEQLVNERTRKLFAFVPQGNTLFSGTIRENVTLLNRACTCAEIDDALKLCSCDFISELPKGIDTVIGERGLGLSEGQVQRLALVRAILSKAPVLLLDEITSALDENTEREILYNLSSLKGKTVIMITHKKAPVAFCKKTYDFADGQLKIR